MIPKVCASKNNMNEKRVGQPQQGQPVSNMEQDGFGSNSSTMDNTTMDWEVTRMDRMEGNIRGKNKPSIMKVGKDWKVVQNTGKPIADR